ncbi:MAG: hypothetical protein RR404_00885 [Bacilli bacterium]
MRKINIQIILCISSFVITLILSLAFVITLILSLALVQNNVSNALYAYTISMIIEAIMFFFVYRYHLMLLRREKKVTTKKKSL